MWTAASSALAAAPSMPTSVPTRSFSTSGPMPSLGSTSRPARSSPTSPSSRSPPPRHRVRVGLGNLLREPLVQRLVLPLADQLGVALRWRVALVEHIVHATIVQGSLWLDLVQLLGLVGDLVRVLLMVMLSRVAARVTSGP